MSVEVEAPDVEMEAAKETPEGEAPAAEGTVASTERKQHPSGRTVIVKNLHSSMLFTFNEDLKTLLGKYGEIVYIKRGGVTIDFQTVEPTLTAYVSFESAESSEKSLDERGTVLNGNPIEMEILRAGEHTVVVSNLPFVISSECIRNLMQPCGPIKEVVKIPARPTAFIEFESEEGLKKALTLNGSIMINNVDVAFGRRTTENTKKLVRAKLSRSQKKAAAGGTVGGRGGGGGSYGGGRGRGSGGRGGYAPQPTWDQPAFPYRPPHNPGGYDSGNMGYGNNWGNGNYDNERMFKRRKQNDWVWQY